MINFKFNKVRNTECQFQDDDVHTDFMSMRKRMLRWPYSEFGRVLWYNLRWEWDQFSVDFVLFIVFLSSDKTCLVKNHTGTSRNPVRRCSIWRKMCFLGSDTCELWSVGESFPLFFKLSVQGLGHVDLMFSIEATLKSIRNPLFS